MTFAVSLSTSLSSELKLKKQGANIAAIYSIVAIL